VVLNPPEEQRVYSGWYGTEEQKSAFALSTLDSRRLWRLADNPVVPYTYWVQLQLPSTATLTGVAVQASAIHGGAMFIGAYHLRYCTDPLPAGGCAAWEHARNTTGGLAFAGPQGSGTYNEGSGTELPDTGSTGSTRSFFEAPIVTTLVRIYPFGTCPWHCGLRVGLLAWAAPPST
jgi:hypothetical protein